MYRSVAIVDGVGIGTRRSDVDRAVCTGNRGAHVGRSAAYHPGCYAADGLRISRVNIRVIGEYIAGWIRSCRAVGHAACFDRRGGIRHRNRRVVATLDRDGNLRGTGQAQRVAHRVGEHVVDRVSTGAQCLYSGVAIVDGIRISTGRGDVDRAVRTSHG